MKKIFIFPMLFCSFLFSCSNDENAVSIRFSNENTEVEEIEEEEGGIEDDTDDEVELIAITYTNDVASVLENYCTSCHGATLARSGFSFHTYDLAVMYSNEIKSTIEVNYMPPSETMLDEDKEIIYAWIEAGLLE